MMPNEAIPLDTELPEGPFPPHHQWCFGCGPANPASLGVQWRRDGNLVRGAVTLDPRHQGVPGIAHGGVVASIIDDAAGSLLVPLHQAAVTARLEVDYVTPVRLHRPLRVVAWLSRRDGRKLHIKVQLSDGDTVIAHATVLLITVAADHLFRYGAQPGGIPAIGI